jgi:molybdenum cofactor synthesis domain-containing protein
LQINVSAEVHAINRSSVATQAMHGATITALTLFNFLQPVDHKIEICSIKLSAQSGGTPAVAVLPQDIRCAVVVCSNSIAAGTKQDGAGKVIRDGLNAQGIRVAAYTIIPDDVKAIQDKARSLASDGFQLVIFCGGTGMLQSDVTPQALAPLIDRPLPGIMQAARAYGQERTPFAMLSRGKAGFINNTLVLTLPGSTRGAEETMVALFPYVLHVFNEEIEGSGSRF